MAGTPGSVATLIIALLVGAASPTFAELPRAVDDMIAHFEFLGYTAERSDDEVVFRKADAPVSIVKLYNKGILLQAHWDAVPQNGTLEELIAAVNQLNNNATLCRYYVDKDNNLYIEYWMQDRYDRPFIGTVLSLWQKEAYDEILSKDNPIHVYVD